MLSLKKQQKQKKHNNKLGRYEMTVCRTYFSDTIEVENRYLEPFDDFAAGIGHFRMPFRM